ncbi:hypothetical protein FACS189487_03140 [Campylobacterota bacterium]|nr:hypothetical protein FACS189487_03140 [Campylobacterota bacterium]
MRRHGFTLVELIFSIVILGILASVTADIVSHIYSRYLAALDTERAQSDTRRTLDILSARLSQRVKNSAVGRNRSLPIANRASVISLDDPRLRIRDYDMLQWVGIAYESQRGEATGTPMGLYDTPPVPLNPPPSGFGSTVENGWTGVAYATTAPIASLYVSGGLQRQWSSPLSDVRIAKAVERRHAYYIDGAIHAEPFEDLTSVAVFAGDDARGDYYGGQTANWGWYNAPGATPTVEVNNYFQVIPSIANFTRFALSTIVGTDADIPSSFFRDDELVGYYFTRSAYALWIDENSSLRLTYNYRPWQGDYFDNTSPTKINAFGSTKPGGSSQVLLKNVTSFLFNETGGVMRLILCVKAGDNVAGMNDNNETQFCRERIVI